MNEKSVCSNNSHGGKEKRTGGERKKNQKDMKESVSDSLHLPQYLTF